MYQTDLYLKMLYLYLVLLEMPSNKTKGNTQIGHSPYIAGRLIATEDSLNHTEGCTPLLLSKCEFSMINMQKPTN